MIKTFTKDHLILLAYKELPPAEAELLKEELEHNATLANAYKEIQETLGVLPSEKRNPHPTSVKIILEEAAHHSKALEV